MNNKTLSSQWAAEFQEFASASEELPPKALSSRIHETIQAELNPSAWLVFFKVAFVHLVMGTITLLFCPQFGISFFQGAGLMGLLMRFGPTLCMLGCGAIFLGSSALAASLILKPEEIKVVRRLEFLQFALLGALSIGVFAFLGEEMILTLTLVWLAGSILGALGSLELGWLVRLHFIQRLTLEI
jgi:hypothetical protein